MNEPIKKRRLLIVDVNEVEMPVQQAAPLASSLPVITGTTPGHIHARVQQEILKLCKEARFDEEKIDARIWHKTDEILRATTKEEAERLASGALDSASVYFLINARKPEKQLKAAERIAKMYRNKGEDEKADRELEKAKKLRAEIATERKL